jgi:hypothetical protein
MKSFYNVVIVLVGIALFHVPVLSLADTTYTTLAPITNYIGEKEEISEATFSKYLDNMFKMGIALCTGLAVLMIIIGGIQYVSSDAWGRKSEGKERILAALLGLVIALGSYALLKTINPELLDTRLELAELNIEGIETMTPRPQTGSGTDRTYTPSSTPVDPNAKMPQEELQQYLMELIAESGLTGMSPSDAAKYFPNGGTAEEWTSLFVDIIKRESNFNPNLTYKESFTDRNGNPVISTGLMQISQESARAYGFPGITTEQLKDPKTNMQVGVAIMKKWVAQDGCVSCKDSSGKWRGGARYWSTLRQ